MKKLLCIALCGILAWSNSNADESVVVEQVVGQFADIKENIVTAIEGRGLVINLTSHIGDMLDRTGKDLGTKQRIYEQAEMLEFCSARASRAMMAAAPAHIVFCPYTIAIYTLPGQAGTVHVAYRRLPELPGLDEARQLLPAITREALH